MIFVVCYRVVLCDCVMCCVLMIVVCCGLVVRCLLFVGDYCSCVLCVAC